MQETVQKLLAVGRGILAADESTKTIEKRFVSIGLISTPELNQKYREMLFTTQGLENYISGVILFEESVKQNLQKILEEKGIVPGIKMDGGLEPFNDSLEQITKVPENLDSKLKEYFQLGLRFTKWRAAIKITDIFPTPAFLEENLNRMVEFAKLSQANQMVPIVEPEILLDGNHTTTRCAEIETSVLTILFEKLKSAGVDLTKLLLKTSMVLPGVASGVKAEPLEVANATLRALKASVPPEVGGIVFLSGGQTPDEATNNLNEIVKIKGEAPWQLSFSFARALQGEALEVWRGKDENVATAQKVFLNRLERVSKARNGEL